ncbi:anti-sigma-F factor Fin family protein [Guptibacillus hwajinpoensis]|uniref:Isocitrate dehydrogenase n=1 Tax=Guptibacillus hwajinpoensis TaxID=208199 RepID=A0ABU0K6U2_9BACL|nr:anti-sigma-F factor Fin family protein [Alkalihalobacillus hemicentroti]MDQ0485090.1 isocitrate dehydrogenase [Alkalihalobacillus hemicentroti]
MDIHYVCRHCGTGLGKVNPQTVSTDELGFQQLTEEERKSMIYYHQDGTIEVKAICEDCHEAMERSPSFHELDTFIQ